MASPFAAPGAGIVRTSVGARPPPFCSTATELPSDTNEYIPLRSSWTAHGLLPTATFALRTPAGLGALAVAVVHRGMAIAAPAPPPDPCPSSRNAPPPMTRTAAAAAAAAAVLRERRRGPVG